MNIALVEDQAFWNEILDTLPPLREELIRRYFFDDEETQAEARDDDENKDCLVWPLLGQEEEYEKEREHDTLRNFPLSLNLAVDMDLDINRLATEMAIGLAIIHWQAEINAMDMEIALGSRPSSDQPISGESTKPVEAQLAKPLNFRRRPIHMWMLDFDKAKRFNLTKADVENELVPAFLSNERYYPRPQVDQKLWDVFEEAYLAASRVVMNHRKFAGDLLELPEYFITALLKQNKITEEFDAERDIVFGD
ncbi:MAG: hypothetical protein Q9218_002194 [Villophora microphyllina]